MLYVCAVPENDVEWVSGITRKRSGLHAMDRPYRGAWMARRAGILGHDMPHRAEG